MLANTIYLLCNRLSDAMGWRLFADVDVALPKLFQAMVLSHTGIGLLTALSMLFFAVLHLPKVWRRRRRSSVLTGIAFTASGLVLTVTGFFVLTAAASRENAWAWWMHIVCAAMVPVWYGIHRGVSFVPAERGAARRFVTGVLTLWVAMLVAHGLSHRGLSLTDEARLAREKGLATGPGAQARDLSAFVGGGFVPSGFVPPGSPFFPSAATTTTGDYLPSRIITRDDLSDREAIATEARDRGFVVEHRIGAENCVRCHPDIVEQWATSAHRFASFNNPFYEATINDMRTNATVPNEWVEEHIRHFPETAGREGMIKSKWCSACHDPSLMLAGKMNASVDRHWPEAQAGLTCLACHAIDSIHNQTGNGNYNIADEQESPYLFAMAKTGSPAAVIHDLILKAKPTVHKRQMKTDVFATSEYCAACHKVSLNRPVNNYRWLRGQNEYDNWNDSGVALNAARTFYLPPSKRVCQDCHMPYEPAPLGDVAARDGMVHSHRFLAANTALPFLRGDTETLERVETFLQAEKLRVDIFAMTRSDGEPPILPLDRRRVAIEAGEVVTLDVVVRNLGVGHTFPGGTNDSNEGWIELTVLDGEGRVRYRSGGVGEDGYVDTAAHFFRAVLVDREGQAIHKRNAQDIYATVYANVIGPGTAHVVHYGLTVPEDTGETLTVRARLLWRKFDRAYTAFAYQANPEGFKQFDRCPDLPITEIASSEVTLRVTTGDAEEPVDDADARESWDWKRLNDYGIGLLLQADTRGAQRAFAELARREPDRIDGHRNLARVAINDGDLESVYQHLLRCEEILPNDPQTAWFWGVLLQEEGRYTEAASAYRRVLQHFPDDRATWRNLGRTYYLDGRFQQAIDAMDHVLGIDPEDRVAHYHIMLAARALGMTERAATAGAAYRLYKIDESATEVTRNYRAGNPHDNLESQAVHVHELTQPGQGGQHAQGYHDYAPRKRRTDG